jgi:hypothetical protein
LEEGANTEQWTVNAVKASMWFYRTYELESVSAIFESIEWKTAYIKPDIRIFCWVGTHRIGEWLIVIFVDKLDLRGQRL